MEILSHSFASAYYEVLHTLLNNPMYVTSPRGMKINEYIGAKISIVNPYWNLFNNPIRSIPLGYLADEICLYFSGTNSAEKFTQASKIWGGLVENDQINSAYGNLIFSLEDTADQNTQWTWAVNSLVSDRDSRQALMHLNRPRHQYVGNKDFPCTVSCQFFIRNDKLHLITYMRSNDVYFGMTFDVPFFTFLMQAMMLSLKGRGVSVGMGTYTHFAGSLHMYERDMPTIKKMLDAGICEPEKAPEIDECPIFHPDIDRIIDGNMPEGNSLFIKWLAEHSTFIKRDQS